MTVGGGLNRHALRTAVISTLTVAALVVALCVAVDLIVATSLRTSAAARLTAQLTQLATLPAVPHSESRTSMIRSSSGSWTARERS